MNNYQKEHYDRINIVLPKGMKDKIKEASESMNASIGEYLMLLISEDISTGTSKLAEKKKGFTQEQEVLLQKLQVPKKYYEMIEDLSFDKDEGYFIHLKKGFINDITGNRNIICQTTKEVRTLIVKSHQVKREVVINGLSTSTIEQLEKWQIPKKYYEMIESIYSDKENGYSIILKEGFTNDFAEGRIIKVAKANTFRIVMKESHPI
jgi:uncharacterized protein YrrD